LSTFVLLFLPCCTAVTPSLALANDEPRRARVWSEAKRSLSNMHEKRGEQGSWFEEKRDSVASTERRKEGKRFMDNACMNEEQERRSLTPVSGRG
jgi:hypothetical protein